MTLREAIIKIQTHAKNAGANEAPNDPTESQIAFPFAACYLSTANIIAESAGMEKNLATVNLDLHVNRFDLPTDVQAVLTFYEAFNPKLIADPTLGGTVSTILMDNSSPIRVEFGQMKYGSVDTLGLRYSITLKQKS